MRNAERLQRQLSGRGRGGRRWWKGNKMRKSGRKPPIVGFGDPRSLGNVFGIDPRGTFREHAPAAPLEGLVHDLRAEMHEMRKEMDEMRRHLERLTDREHRNED